tara:strand:- start:3693 stop:4772 length:1080 start_codon:yes stop_codon:yes gene_type:complete
MSSKANRLYSARIFTTLSIIFITMVVPFTTSTAVNLAYIDEQFEVNHPESLRAINPGNVSGTPHLVQWNDYSNNLSYQWSYFDDRPETNPIINEDCEPYDWLNSAPGYPSTHYSIQNRYATNLTSTPQYVNADDPFKAPTILCSTLNDDIGIRITPAAILGTSRAGQTSNKSIGLAMTSFNASMVMFRAGLSGYNSTLYAEFDWRVEIDGVYMFGENVRKGEPDSYILNEGVFGNNSIFYPQTKFKHDLTIDEERRVRDAIAGKDINNLNMTLIWRCHETQSNQVGYPLAHEACEFFQTAVSNSINTDASFHVSTTWIEADDYDFWIQGTAWILSIVMIVMAIGSTPLWDPFKKSLGGI